MVMLQNQCSEENPLFRSLSLILSRTEQKSLQRLGENSFEQKQLNEVMASSVKMCWEKTRKKILAIKIFVFNNWNNEMKHPQFINQSYHVAYNIC